MDEIIIPLQNIRKKEDNKRKIEINKNPNQREQLNIFLEDNSDTSSDYNSNFIYFPNNEIPLFDIKKIRDFHHKQIYKKANLNKEKDILMSNKILIVLNKMNTSSESDDDRIYDDSEYEYDYDDTINCGSSDTVLTITQVGIYIRARMICNIPYSADESTRLHGNFELGIVKLNDRNLNFKPCDVSNY